MSEAPRALKDVALERYFQALFVMYGMEGWRVLMEDFERLRVNYDTVAGVDTVEDLWFRRGQLDVVNQMLTHAARSEAGYNNAIEEEGGEPEESTGGVAKVIA